MRAKVDDDKMHRCSACGEDSGANHTEYCAVCGKLLSEDYQPLDAIRSSYGLQRTALSPNSSDMASSRSLFENADRNGASQMAWACLVYSFVPYIGILFVPITLLIGAAGVLTAVRRPEIGGGKLATSTIGLSIPVFTLQIFLWWLLYFIPTIGSGA
ncbi:hypothetical protein BH24ACI3_BH24ACI3_02250 [soil metagenome]